MAGREHSACEMKQKLAAKGFGADEVGSALEDLIASRLLSDERFAESLVRSRVNKGVGPVRLRQELREHNIPPEMSEPFVQAQDWRALAVNVYKKRFGKARCSNYQEQAKQMRFLQYRGFEMDQIRAVINNSEWDSCE